MRLEVTDSEGASSGIEERWVSVQNVHQSSNPSPVLPVAEGKASAFQGHPPTPLDGHAGEMLGH